MKKSFTILFLISFMIFLNLESRAQTIPNSDFENWHTSATTGRLVPDEWDSSDDDFNFASVVQSTGYNGTYSVRLKYVGTNASYISFYGGPVSAKPYGVVGYWRDHTNNTTDQGSCSMYVYDTLSGLADHSVHTPFLSEISNWEQFVNFVPSGNLANTPYYFSVDISCEAINSSSWVDVDGITVLLTGVDELGATLGNYVISPTVSSGKFQIYYCMLRTTPVTISVFDLTGKKVREVFTGSSTLGNHYIDINLENFESGMYYCKLDTDKGSKSIKIIVD